MFFLSLGIILLLGGLVGFLFQKVKLPSLLGYLLLGILLGYFNLLDEGLLINSAQIRKIALIIILLKAGLTLNLSDLKKVGRPAIMMSFIPAVLEMCAICLLAPLFLDLTYVESFLLGSVLGAVSPAVVVPRMTKMIKEGYGVKKGLPQLIIAGSSIDDIVMIVFFNAFLTAEKGGGVSALSLLNIPVSIVLGILVGVGLGFLLVLLFKKVHMRDSLKLVLIIGVSCLLVYLEDLVSPYVSFSSLLSVISLGLVISMYKNEVAYRIQDKCDKLWTVGELFLFVLVGASIQISYFSSYFLSAVILLICSLAIRVIGVNLCLIKTDFNLKERSFISISYLPKATVQAALGGVLLDLGNSLNDQRIISSGIIVLSICVVSILLTAPLAAFSMDLTYKKLTLKDEGETKTA